MGGRSRMGVEHAARRSPPTAPLRALPSTVPTASGVLELQQLAGNAAVAATVGGLHPTMGLVRSGTGSAMSVQRDASREVSVAAFRSALAQGDWRQAAVRLNGFNPDDIKFLAGGLSLGQAANLRAALLIHLDGWGQQPALLSALDQGGSEVKRIGDLYAKYERAVAASDWSSAADTLGPMTREDIDARLGKLTQAQRDGIAAVAAGREPLTAALRTYSILPVGTTYADIKDDLAYIDNFESASYDVFRRELHLTFEDGHEAALPISQTQSGMPPR